MMKHDAEAPADDRQAPLLATDVAAAAAASATAKAAALAPAVVLALLLIQVANAVYGVVTEMALRGDRGVNPLVSPRRVGERHARGANRPRALG